MADKLIIVSWRDIPAQVIVKAGRKTARCSWRSGSSRRSTGRPCGPAPAPTPISRTGGARSRCPAVTTSKPRRQRRRRPWRRSTRRAVARAGRSMAAAPTNAMYAVRLWSIRHAGVLGIASTGLRATVPGRVPRCCADRATSVWRSRSPRSNATSKGLLFDCQMCGQCVLSSHRHVLPDELPEAAAQRPLRRRARRRPLRSQARDALRLGAGLGRLAADALRAIAIAELAAAGRPSAAGAARPGCGCCASSLAEWRHREIRRPSTRPDPLPLLPGHSSRGRLERVLRAGRFAVTTELNPPDSADPREVYDARRGTRRSVRCDQRHRCFGRPCPHVQRRRLCAADACRLCRRSADLLPRQEPYRDPGRRAGRAPPWVSPISSA